jgi:hypothetical protein
MADPTQLGNVVQYRELLIGNSPNTTRLSEWMSMIEGNVGKLTLTAGETLNGQKLLMISNGQAYLFDPSDESNADRVLGFSTHAADQGDQVTIQRTGPLSSMVLTPNATYYAGPSGSITPIVPASGLVLRVGMAKDSSTLLIDIGIPIFTIN